MQFFFIYYFFIKTTTSAQQLSVVTVFYRPDRKKTEHVARETKGQGGARSVSATGCLGSLAHHLGTIILIATSPQTEDA